MIHVINFHERLTAIIGETNPDSWPTIKELHEQLSVCIENDLNELTVSQETAKYIMKCFQKLVQNPDTEMVEA